MSGVKTRDVVGWFGAASASAIVAGVVGIYNGSLGVVWNFASQHPLESILWSALCLLMGALLGMLIRHLVAACQLRQRDAERASEIAGVRSESAAEIGERDERIRSFESELESLRAELASRPTADKLAESEKRVSEMKREIEYLRSGDGSESARIERLAGSVGSLSKSQKGVLRETLFSGEYWSGESDDASPQVLERYGYLEQVKSSLSKGRCYTVPLSLRKTILASEDAMSSLSDEGGEDGEDLHADNFSRTFSLLSNREKYCIARLVEVEDANKGMSVSANGVIRPAFESLVKMGMAVRVGKRAIGGKPVVSYTVAPEWREWLRSHTELFSGVTETDAGLGNYTVTKYPL